MSIEIEVSNAKTVIAAQKLKVSAEVRYWEDATVNGIEDSDGSLIPFRNGDLWQPVIDLETGKFLNWPEGTTADIHYKVCDAGEYWLLNGGDQEVAKWNDHYVPDKLLCHGARGYGDYIILKVNVTGQIEKWRTPSFEADDWSAV